MSAWGIDIREYIGNEKELTAEEVRRLPVGTTVIQHSFDRHGEHQQFEAQIAKRGKRSVLYRADFFLGPVYKEIKKETERMCYTLGSA